MPRFCACGAKIAIVSKRKTCWRCRERTENQERVARKIQKQEQLQAVGRVLVHSCLSHPYDPIANCLCRKTITFEEAEKLVARGAAIDIETRMPVFCERPIIELRAMHTPRTATIEKAHIERVALSQSFKPLVRESDAEQKERLEREFRELKIRIEQDRADRAEEELCRWQIWRELSEQFMDALTVPIDPEEFDREKAAAQGRPFIFVTGEERSSVGRNVNFEMTFADDAGGDEDRLTEFREITIDDDGNEVGNEVDDEVEDDDGAVLSE